MHGSLEDHFLVIRIPWLNKVIIIMGDDDMEYTEAVEAAVSKRKPYLLNSLFDKTSTET